MTLHRGGRRPKVLEVQEQDHTAIIVTDAEQIEIADQFDISQSSVRRYLLGQFVDDNPNMPLILQVREAGKKRQKGRWFYICRDEDERLRCFETEPRRDRSRGVWYNYLDPRDEDPTLALNFPEELLPPGCDPRWEKRDIYLIHVEIELNRKYI